MTLPAKNKIIFLDTMASNVAVQIEPFAIAEIVYVTMDGQVNDVTVIQRRTSAIHRIITKCVQEMASASAAVVNAILDIRGTFASLDPGRNRLCAFTFSRAFPV